MKKGLLVLLVIVVLLLCFVGYGINVHNTMVSKDETAEKAMADIDTVLQRRADYGSRISRAASLFYYVLMYNYMLK